jgi:fluoride ion exporter CrcB/FEX
LNLFATPRSTYPLSSIWVGIGGGLGGVARYAIEQLMVRLTGAVVWGTLLVNVLVRF